MSWSPTSVLDAHGLPLPADEAAVCIGRTRWLEAADDTTDANLAAFMRDLAHAEVGERLLAAIFGNSPFLTQCCLQEPAFLRRLVNEGPDGIFAELIDGLNHHLDPAADRVATMTALRLARRRTALLIALSDMEGHWSLPQVTGALSGFAEAALGAVARHLLAKAHGRELALPHPADPERDSGLIILGMGKLGAIELNYSSDIDLILLYDPEKVRFSGSGDRQSFFTRLAGDLVRMMADRTRDGYVFRTDLRLRPDPGSTPLALSVPAALAYYESAGQNWERAALIKARAVAGDRAAGRAFLGELRPFLWRKHLDFAAIQDIHSIKRQINAHRGGARIAVAGHNIKLGRGGIREIEFFAQTQQLIWGGRLPTLRVAGTCDALAALAAAGRISHETAATLTEAYVFARRVEHRLQMVDDAQTHTLPGDAEGLRRLAIFLGYGTTAAFTSELTRHLTAVEASYAGLFEEAPTLAGPGNLVFTGIEDDPETLTTLGRLGFADPPAVAGAIRGWHHGRYAATRSQRARELLTELIPGLLKAIGETAHPDAAFLSFDRFLRRLPAGVQILSLLYQNPPLLALIAEIMGTGARMADVLARRPSLLDAVLSDGFFEAPPDRAALAEDLERQLAGAHHYEETLTLARRWASDRKFQISVQILRHRIDGTAAGRAFADVAETVIAGLLPHVGADFARAHGQVPGGHLAVLGLGKLGSAEMTIASDLDLILVYDAPSDVEGSDGARSLPVATYYARWSQRFINALTAPTGDGAAYDVDMRLRPSGAAGPIATGFAAFRRYHEELAWTWEQMALTRARPVGGSPDLADRVMATVRDALTRPRDPDRLVVDVADMRRRIAEQHRNPGFFDVKHAAGGMVDVEFIAQYLQLREAAARPQVLRQNTAEALAALAASGVIEVPEAEALLHALRLWRDVQGLLRLTVDGPFDDTQAPDGLRTLLAQGAGSIDFPSLKAAMVSAAARARACYEAVVDKPAAEVRSRLDLASLPTPPTELPPL
jgi:glutamate-ammonia-ligase adenylyltransferase